LSALLAGAVLGLDVSIFIVQLIKSSLYYEACLDASEEGVVGNVPAVVKQFERMLLKLMSWGCTPVLVFDGSLRFKPKDGERKRREDARRAAQDKLMAGGPLSLEEKRKLLRASFKPGQRLMQAVACMAYLHGIPFMFSPMQADQQLTYLQAIGVVDFIASLDSDLAVFGTRVLRALDLPCDRGELYVEDSGPPGSCPLSTLLAGASFPKRCIARAALAALGGNDYYRIQGVGPARAMTALQAAVVKVGGIGAVTLDSVLGAAMDFMESKGWLGGTRSTVQAATLGIRVSAYAYFYEPVISPSGIIKYGHAFSKVGQVRVSQGVIIDVSQSGSGSGASQGGGRNMPVLVALPPPADIAPMLGIASESFWDVPSSSFNRDPALGVRLACGGDFAPPRAAACVGGVAGGLAARPGDRNPPSGAHLVPAHVSGASFFHMLRKRTPLYECVFENTDVLSLSTRLEALPADDLKFFLSARGVGGTSDNKTQLVNTVEALATLGHWERQRLSRVDDPNDRERVLRSRLHDAQLPPSGPGVVFIPAECATVNDIDWGFNAAPPGGKFARINFAANNTLLLDNLPHLAEAVIYAYYVGKEGMKAAPVQQVHHARHHLVQHTTPCYDVIIRSAARVRIRAMYNTPKEG
jgi:5'-3' exonuclease